MRVTFVLPSYSSAPCGGFKVVYEYANRLAARGHGVTLLHPRSLVPQPGWSQRLKSRLWPHKIRWQDGRLVPWFDLRPEVQVRLLPDLDGAHVPPADVVIATSWVTAPHVAGYDEGQGRKLYLIQGYETWGGPPEEVEATWHLPLRKIVVSRWLLTLAEHMGEGSNTRIVPNGLDFGAFHLTEPLAGRPRRIGMLYHPAKFKGAGDGLMALIAAKRQRPDLEAVLFGCAPRPADLPAWIDYRSRPAPAELRRIYNSCSIFLQPSWSEGWGLAATEAMACGCALITADNGGSNEYALDGRTALVHPARDPGRLGELLEQLLSDDELRQDLAAAGQRHVRQYEWDTSVAALERLLLCWEEAPCPYR